MVYFPSEEHGEDEEGESDFLAGDMQGMEFGDLGDLSDVPQVYLREVVDLLRSLPGPEDDPGNIHSLRGWIQSMKRLAGFSREATLQLFVTIARCVEAERPKGYGDDRHSLQKAFVRLEGVRETINTMLLRLNDPVVVAKAARTLAAAVQNNSLAAEAMFDGGADKVRLMLRAIERHESHFDVVENACLLMMHLCSLTAKPYFAAAPTRVNAHREIQCLLAAEGGVIDLLVNFLAVHVERVKEQAHTTEEIYADVVSADKDITLARPGTQGSTASSVVANVEAVKKKVELRQAWSNLNTVEATGARIQELVLQALLLIVFGNPDTTRQLMGQLWVWGNTQHLEKHPATSQTEERAKQKATQPSGKKKRGNVLQPNGAARKHVKGGKAAAATVVPELVQPNLLEDKRSLTTLDAFAKVSLLLLEVLKGRAARDRPELASKVVRLLSVFVDHNVNRLRHIEAARSREFAELAVRLRPGTVPGDNRKPLAPFAALRPIISSLTLAMRIHEKNVTLLTEALSTLVKLKDLALLSSPAGVEQGSDTLVYAWQRLLADAEQKGELESASTLLKKAVEDTDLANERIRIIGATTDDLTGETMWLTPRLRDTVASTTLGAAELVGDALASRWSNGEPSRWERKCAKSDPEAAILADAAHPSHPMGQAKAKQKPGKNGSAVSTRRRNATIPELAAAPKQAGRRRESTEIPRQMAEALNKMLEAGDQGSSPAARSASKVKKDKTKQSKEPKEDKQKEEVDTDGYHLSVGFEKLEETEFQQIWHEPLQDALTRSLSVPSLKQQRIQKLLEAQSWQQSEDVEACEADTTAKVFSSINPELIESAPGLLRARVVLPSMDHDQYKASEQRLRQLMAGQTSSEVSTVLSKSLRKSGCLMPVYGFDLQFKKGSRTRYLEGLSNAVNIEDLAGPGGA